HAKTQNDTTACDDAYRNFTVGSIVGYGLGIIISIHFATVIREYSIRRKAEEDNPNNPDNPK
ncbi:566_t:CDS:2, partial [Racocetra persica]